MPGLDPYRLLDLQYTFQSILIRKKQNRITMKKLTTTALLLMVTLQLFAQGEGSSIVNTMEGSDKIYVVVVCVTVILAGLLFFLFSIERRIKKLEKKSK